MVEWVQLDPSHLLGKSTSYEKKLLTGHILFRYVPGARWDPVTPFGGGYGLPGRGGGGRGGRQHG